MFRALMIHPEGDTMVSEVKELPDGELPEGDTTVEVLFSSLNYKDGLAITGKSPIVRGDFPFIPGIDLVGRVLESHSDHSQRAIWSCRTAGASARSTGEDFQRALGRVPSGLSDFRRR